VMKFVRLNDSDVNPTLVLSVDNVTAKIGKEPNVVEKKGAGVLLLGAERPFFVPDKTREEVTAIIEGGLNAS